MSVEAQDTAEVEASRERFRTWLGGPDSFLAAVSRHELPIGQSLRFGDHGDVKLADAGATLSIAASDDAFQVDGVRRGPGIVPLGRYRLRLSHQNAPAVVVLDPEAQHATMEPRWYAYDPAFRFTLALEPNRTRIALASTRERARAAEQVGWLGFKLGRRNVRIAVTRLTIIQRRNTS